MSYDFYHYLHEERITYPPGPHDRPHQREFFSDGTYNMLCHPIPFGTFGHSCSSNPVVERKWKEDVFCGRYNKYNKFDIAKIWNKAVGDTEYLTHNIFDVACVSATTLFLTGIHDCPNYETTADLLFEHNLKYGWGLNFTQILTLAEFQVKSKNPHFHASDCGHYIPKFFKDSRFDCETAFKRTSYSDFEVDHHNRPNHALSELIDYAVFSFKYCGYYDDGFKFYESDTVYWSSDYPFHTYYMLFYDYYYDQLYEIHVSGDFKHGLIFKDGHDDFIRWSFDELCPDHWPVFDYDDEVTQKIKFYYNMHPKEVYHDAFCHYKHVTGDIVEEFFFLPTHYLSSYDKSLNGTQIFHWGNY